MKTTETVVAFLKNVLAASDIDGKRGKLDVFCDRLTRAASEPTLEAAMESLLRSLHTSADLLHPPMAASMLAVAGSAEGPRVLAWMRAQPKLITMLAATRDEALVADALAQMELPQMHGEGHAIMRRPCEILLHAICESPLAHGSDQKAGNATLFRRIHVLATNDAVLHLPYYSGNAVRGQVRDLLADHLLASLGLPVDRSKPAVALWFFYALYSGGALEEKSDAMKALKKELGDHGAIRGEGIRAFRDHLPALSLLGCALGNRVLPGRVQFADLRPVCAEWGQGEQPIAEMLAWEWLTRREDHEDHEEHHGMIASTEVLRTGTHLEGGVDHDSVINPLERAALGRGLELLVQRGMLGAENRRGLGRVELALTNAPGPAPYDAWLLERKEEILAYLGALGALA